MRIYRAAARWIPATVFLAATLSSPPIAIASKGGGVPSPQPARAPYGDLHPRLLFTPAELPELRAQVKNGGNAQRAYLQILDLIRYTYPGQTYDEILEFSIGTVSLPNLALAAHIEAPPDTAATALGRELTLYLADNFQPDDNVFFSPLRLRAIALGYDAFFSDGSDDERQRLVGLIEDYIDMILDEPFYRRWLQGPYLSNITSMIGSALGFGAVCIADETDPERVRRALDAAQDYVAVWMETLVDPQGSYNEGGMYAGWSMANVCYYAWARKRWDGFDPADTDRLRNMERWIAHSMLPQGGAKVNNLNDAASLNLPWSRHHTYFEWAQQTWQSGLSAWIWERIAGPDFGYDAGFLADKAATVLWNRDLPPVHPAEVLPTRMLWKQRGLYYFRTGWPTGEASDDVVFSFYSGKFEGGHSQEDQNNFTLYGYGEAFAIDHGFGLKSSGSAAHNMIFIDGKGQHFSRGSVGTDGNFKAYLLGDDVDYLLGDATKAYTTYSDLNRPGYPFPDDDWSWGYFNANPVWYAYRHVLVVHGDATPPHFLFYDDIQKDASVRKYAWRMHTIDTNTLDISTNPVRISGATGSADVHILSPGEPQVSVSTTPFDNGDVDPNSNILSLSTDTNRARFGVLIVPGGPTTQRPTVASTQQPWGTSAELTWPEGQVDIITMNASGAVVTLDLTGSSVGGPATLSTDATLSRVRFSGGAITHYALYGASTFSVDDRSWAVFPDGPLNVSASETRVRLDRDADFTVYAPDGIDVRHRDVVIATVASNGYVSRDPVPDAPVDARHLRLRAFPNPFRANTSIEVEIGDLSPIAIEVYDVRGRLVRTLWTGNVQRGYRTVTWDGRNNNGAPVASGVYLVKASSSKGIATQKIQLIR